MNQSVHCQTRQEKQCFAPLAVFYLVAVLGLLLGAWQQASAEPISGSPASQAVQTESKPLNGIATAEENSKNNAIIERNLASPSLTIPGIQSAILTVSKEIKTTAPIANLSTKPGNVQKAKSVAKLTENKAAKSSNQQATPVVKGPEGYFLELPAPTGSAGPETETPATSGETALIEPATTVPVAPVPSRFLETGDQQATPQNNPLSIADPESLPLVLTEASTLSGAATDALVRVTLGLMAVLGLMLAFSRVVLPRLMARYPAFFENLKRQGNKAPQQALKSEQTIPATVPVTAQNEEKLAQEIKASELALATQVEMTSAGPTTQLLDEPPALDACPSEKPSKKNSINQYRFLWQALRRRKEQPKPSESSKEAPFTLLFTSSLGKDKELHLVEIQGRQMVIASTPYSISLIRDLSEPGRAQRMLGGEEGLFSNSEHFDLDFLLPSNPDSDSQAVIPDAAPLSGASQDDGEWSPQILLGLELDEAAHSKDTLSGAGQDGTPQGEVFAESAQEEDNAESGFIAPKGNAYATRPQRLVPLTEADRLYQRYLEILSPPNQEAPASESAVSEGVLPAPSLQSVVILNEYDDTYGY